MNPVLSLARDAAVVQGRRISRTFYRTLQGPYTSVILSDDSGTFAYQVSERTALSIASVYAAVGIYSDLLGTLPVKRYRGDEQLPPPSFVVAPQGYELGWTREVGQLIWAVLLRGNGWAYPTAWDSAGFPIAFEVWDPNRVGVKLDDRGRVVVRYSRGLGLPDIELTDPGPSELLHIPWQAPPGCPFGSGILDVNAAPGSTLATAYTANVYAGDLMANPTPPAVLTHPLRLNKGQAEDLQTQWAESIGRKRAVPAVLSGGITYAPLTVSARDVQLIETRRWNATEIATLFRLPPYMLGGSTGDSLTYSTVEGEMIRLWTTALQPMAVRLERAFSAWLPHGQVLRFNPDAVLRSQTVDRYNAHRIALDPAAPFMTVEEVRELENRGPLPASEKPTPPPPALPEVPE